MGVPIFYDSGIEYVTLADLSKALKTKGRRSKFHKLFGVQTCPESGLYPWDVEAVLERMASGRLQGSQKFWD